VTINESSNLDRSEVDRMIADAEAHRSEDTKLREVVDARNELDSAAYQVERRLNELGDAVPEHDRARADMLVGEARQAVKEDAPLDRLRSLTSDLQQMYQALSVAQSASPPPGGQSSSGIPGQDTGTSDDDVIDADFTTN
jgi:molecular chaperone DnaK